MAWQDTLSRVLGSPRVEAPTPMDNMDIMDTIPTQTNSVHSVHIVHSNRDVGVGAECPAELKAEGLHLNQVAQSRTSGPLDTSTSSKSHMAKVSKPSAIKTQAEGATLDPPVPVPADPIGLVMEVFGPGVGVTWSGITCGRCRHFRPGTGDPAYAIGACMGKPHDNRRGQWPKKRHQCLNHELILTP